MNERRENARRENARPILVSLYNHINPETGLTIREENQQKQHSIPIGTLVEILGEDEDDTDQEIGVRLHVVFHDRDCDGSPIYGLGILNRTYQAHGKTWGPYAGAYSAESLSIIRPIKPFWIVQKPQYDGDNPYVEEMHDTRSDAEGALEQYPADLILRYEIWDRSTPSD